MVHTIFSEGNRATSAVAAVCISTFFGRSLQQFHVPKRLCDCPSSLTVYIN